MQLINIIKFYPNQNITFVINNQANVLSLYYRDGYFYADLTANAIEIISGASVTNGSPINPYNNNTGYVGYVFFYSELDEDPTIDNIGDTMNLYYSETKPDFMEV